MSNNPLGRRLSALRRAARHFARAEDGASAVEFALTAPVFIVILAGILVYGIYFSTTLAVDHVAAEAARASVAGVSDTERASLATAKVTESMSGNALLDSSRMTVSASASASNAQVFVVKLNYDASSLPIYGLSGLIPMPPTQIVASASVQHGGF